MWTWTDGGEKLKPEEQKRRFKQFREAGINAVLFSSFNAAVLARAKDHGLETHAWTWALCRGRGCNPGHSMSKACEMSLAQCSAAASDRSMPPRRKPLSWR